MRNLFLNFLFFVFFFGKICTGTEFVSTNPCTAALVHYELDALYKSLWEAKEPRDEIVSKYLSLFLPSESFIRSALEDPKKLDEKTIDDWLRKRILHLRKWIFLKPTGELRFSMPSKGKQSTEGSLYFYSNSLDQIVDFFWLGALPAGTVLTHSKRYGSGFELTLNMQLLERGDLRETKEGVYFTKPVSLLNVINFSISNAFVDDFKKKLRDRGIYLPPTQAFEFLSYRERQDLSYLEVPTKFYFNGARIRTLLESQSLSAESLIYELKTDPTLSLLFAAKVKVPDGYTLEEHTLNVISQFEKYFSLQFQPPIEGLTKSLMRFILSVHDLGKPIASQEGDNFKQHFHTLRFLGPLMVELGFSNREREIAEVFLSSDPIGNYLIWGKFDEAQEYFKSQGFRLGVSPLSLFNALLFYFFSDASAYTRDSKSAGSAVDTVLVFDKENKKIHFSWESQSKIQRLIDALK